MICEKCGCDYARSRPARPEWRDAGARLREMGDGRGVDPALARGRRGLAPVPAS